MKNRKLRVKLYKVRSFAQIHKLSKEKLEIELFLVETKLQLMSAKIYILNIMLEDMVKRNKVIK